MAEVVATDEFTSWYEELDENDTRAVFRSVQRLETMGVSLGFPYSSEIKGSRYALRELRLVSQGHALRVFYVFDPRRQAVLLVGGDKTGDNRFYETFVHKAEGVYEQYLAEQAAALHAKKEAT